MDYTKLIHDFMDGSLEGTQEEQLFYQFSSNDELRAELKQQIAIREAIRNDSRAYTPAANSTVGVFAALGFNPPSTVTVPNSSIAKGGVSGFLTKYKQGITGGVISAVATTALILLLLNPFGSTYTNMSDSEKPSMVQSQVIPDNVPKVESFSNDAQKQQVRYITKIRYIDVPRYINKEPVNNVQESTSSITSAEESNNLDLTSSNLGTSLSPRLDMSNNTNGFSDLGVGTSTNKFNNLILPGEQIGLSLELRGSQYWNYQTETINPFKYSKFNNSAIALYYNLSDNFAFGGEVRQENFFQKYNSIKGDSTFQQQPNFTTFGLNLRYTLPFEFWGFAPFIQANAGVNNAGYTGRGMVGFKYSPYRDITFVVGGETSWLFYHHQNKQFNSGKFGLNYGISFNF